MNDDSFYQRSLRQLRDFLWSYEASCGMGSTFEAMVQVMLLGGPQDTGVNGNDTNLRNLHRFERARQAYLGLLSSQQRVIDLVCHERPDAVPVAMRELFRIEHGGLSWDLYFLARQLVERDIAEEGHLGVSSCLSGKRKAALMKSLKAEAEQGFLEALGAYADLYHAIALQRSAALCTPGDRPQGER